MPPSSTAMLRYLLLLLVLALPVAAQDWTPIDLGTTATLRAIEQGSFSVRYLVGDGGYVSQSNPTFTVWTPVNVGTTADLLSVIQPSLGQAWISGRGGVVRVRDTGGVWNVRDIPSAQDYVLFTRSSGQALAAGSGGSIWKSVNGGVSWTLQNSGTTTPLHAGIGGTFGDGYVVGDGGLILKTTDQGATWTPLPSGTTEDLYGIQQTGVVSGVAGIVAVGANGTILISKDDGETWTPRASGTTATLRGLSRSGQSAFGHLAVGDGGVVRRSLDNGETWCVLETGGTTDFNTALMRLSMSHYLAAGEGGVLLSNETGGTCLPAVDATLTRVGTGSIPPGGGPIQFRVTLQNTTDEVQAFEAWVDAVIPGGNVFGPFLGPQAVTLNPGQTVGPLTFTKNVPANAPTGSYTVRLRVGLSPSALLDESTFVFSKSAALRGEPVSAVVMHPEDWSGPGEPAFLESARVEAEVPLGYTLSAVYPSPVRSDATLTLAVADTQPVRVVAYDMLGRPVRTLYDGVATAGAPLPLHIEVANWPSGVYLIRAEGAAFVATRSVVVVR